MCKNRADISAPAGAMYGQRINEKVNSESRPGGAVERAGNKLVRIGGIYNGFVLLIVCARVRVVKVIGGRAGRLQVDAQARVVENRIGANRIARARGRIKINSGSRAG